MEGQASSLHDERGSNSTPGAARPSTVRQVVADTSLPDGNTAPLTQLIAMLPEPVRSVTSNPPPRTAPWSRPLRISRTATG